MCPDIDGSTDDVPIDDVPIVPVQPRSDAGRSAHFHAGPLLERTHHAGEIRFRTKHRRPPRCHHVVTHNLAKLTDHLFVAGTPVPTVSPRTAQRSNRPTSVSADRLSALEALRVDRRVTGEGGRQP